MTLRTRLTFFYAAGIFAAGLVVLAAVTLPLVGVRSTTAVGVTGTGQGIGPHQLLVSSVVAVAVLVPVSVLAGWYVAGRFLRPLRVMATTATAISAGNLHRRLDLGEPTDELTALGAVLDDLFARLEASFEAHRHFVANASHELRTPLAGQRTLLEVALADPTGASLRAACEEALTLNAHQERLVGALLDLATSERGPTRRDPVDLAAVAADVIAGRPATAELAPVVTLGDPHQIEVLISNLVENALRHGDRAHVTTTAPAVLTISNTGPVVPPDQLDRLFQPFQTLSPGGHGLGLAIVAAVARAHHAALTATAPPTGGLTVTLRFPMAPT